MHLFIYFFVIDFVRKSSYTPSVNQFPLDRAVVHLLCADIPQSTECSLPSVNMPTTPALLPVRRSFRHPGVKMKWSHFQTKGGLSRLLDAPGKASTKYGSIESILSTKKKHRLNHGEAIAKGFGPYHLALPLR